MLKSVSRLFFVYHIIYLDFWTTGNHSSIVMDRNCLWDVFFVPIVFKESNEVMNVYVPSGIKRSP